MREDGTRVLRVNYDTGRLHSAIAGAIRRKQIPNNMLGYDIIRGTVYGMLDHPEYLLDRALGRAVECSKIPGSVETFADGFSLAFECIDTVLRDEDFYDKEDGRSLTEAEIVRRVISGIVEDIHKEYAYSVTVNFLKEAHVGESIQSEILKNMIFKKLVADESTKKCIYEFAFKKAFVADNALPEEKTEEVINETLKGFIPEGKDPYEYVLECVDKIYAENEKDA